MGRYTQGMVAAALAGSVAGCAAFQSFQPAAADSCRDSATGRFVSCGSGGGDSTGVLVAAGVVLGLAAVGGIIYLAARSPSQGVAPDATRPATAPELELVDPPRDVDPRHLCDGPDGFARVTPLTCGEHGYAYHEGPPPLGVVFGGGAPPDRYVAPERICVLRGRRVVVPAGHPCRLHDPDAARP